MANHPNRGGEGSDRGRSPTPAEIIAAREQAGLTQTEAARKIHGTLRSWQHYEAAEGIESHRRMHPGLFELFLIKCGLPVPDWLK
jgi:putative transcriptional regulator